MALNLTGLNAYTNENAMDLIKEAILRGRTVDLVQVQGGIKSAATINRLSTTLNAAAGACGWSATNSTILDQRTITVCDIKVNESVCLNDLENYYTQIQMNPGSYNTDIPFEQLYAENKRDVIMALIEDLIWRGNTSTGSGNLALCDGFVKLFDAATSSTLSNYGTYSSNATTLAATIVTKVDEAIGKINSDIIDTDDLHLFMGYPDYRIYARALRDLNYFAYTGAENQGQEFSQIHPGTNVRVIAVRGLNSASRWVLTRASNLYVGTDLLSDAEDFRIFYSQDNDEVRFLAKWKLGVQVAWLDEVVYYKAI
jgi:hypothetical protein